MRKFISPSSFLNFVRTVLKSVRMTSEYVRVTKFCYFNFNSEFCLSGIGKCPNDVTRCPSDVIIWVTTRDVIHPGVTSIWHDETRWWCHHFADISWRRRTVVMMSSGPTISSQLVKAFLLRNARETEQAKLLSQKTERAISKRLKVEATAVRGILQNSSENEKVGVDN